MIKASTSKVSFRIKIYVLLKTLFSLQTIGCVGTMYSVSPKLTGLMVTVVPAIIGTGTVMGSGLRKMSKEAQNQVGGVILFKVDDYDIIIHG